MSNVSASATRPNRAGWRPTVLFWIVAAVILLLVIASAASTGFGGVLVMLGFVALLTGLYALIFKRQSWVGIPHRKSASLVTGAGVVAFLVGGGIVGATAAPSDSVNKAGLVVAPSESASPTPTESNPANSACPSADQSRTYRDEVFICTMARDGQ
ncbi:MAG: excalibur calcium-binding protein, partial [Arthrobacter sp.]|nr:excalibur calcium-binding protein [Arthrobacter sp.]